MRSKTKLTYASPEDPLLKRLVINMVEFASGRKKLERLYEEIHELAPDPPEVWGIALKKLGITIDYDPLPLKKVPREGPVVFVANHPFGVVDGLMLGHLVSQVRPKFFLLVNEVLAGQRLLQRQLLPVDFRNTREAMHTNILTKQEAIRRLKAGEALAIFPSGGVATAPRLLRKAEDLEWKRFVARVIQQSEATVVPLYFYGQNSRLFQLASHLSMNLRLSLLLFEMRNKMNKQLKVTVGEPIPFAQLRPFHGRQELLDYIRVATLALGNRENMTDQ